MMRDSVGRPDRRSGRSSPPVPAPFVSRDSTYKGGLGIPLDEGKTALAGAGASFAFTLQSGFAGFDTPATFLKFNRALKARVEVIRGSQAAASRVTLTPSPPSPSRLPRRWVAHRRWPDLDVGPTHVYSAAAGDGLNANSFASAELTSTRMPAS